MFRENISTPIDPIPVEYTNTLKRLANEPDYSLTCLGIALLRPRIENYHGIDGCYQQFENENTCVDDVIAQYNNYGEEPTFFYYTYSHGAENREELIQKLTDNGFQIKKNIGAFIKEKASIDCIAAYREDRNFGCVLINSRELRFYHVIISFISLLYPGLFKDAPLEKPKEYEIIVSLSKNDKTLFVERIKKAMEPYIAEFRHVMLKELLKGMHDIKINQARDNVDTQRNYLDTAKRELADAFTRLKELIVIYEGLKATESFDEPEEELVDYLSTNKLIHNLSVNGNLLNFTVATLLNNYNADTWEVFNRRGHIFDGEYYQEHLLDVFNTEENRKKLLNSIFCETPEFSVKIAGNYTIDLYSNSVTCTKMFDYEAADPMFKSYVPNPHIKRFGCLGGYDEAIPKQLERRNYIGAIELCCASAGSVDLDETDQTFRPFLGWIMSSREKILQRNDGVEMTPEEALVYLVDKENANETN